MIFYDNGIEKNSHGVFNDEGYLVMHWGYRYAIDEFKELMQRYEWMRTYINTVSRQEGKKFFVYDGDADEINEMLEEIEERQKLIFKLLKIGN